MKAKFLVIICLGCLVGSSFIINAHETGNTSAEDSTKPISNKTNNTENKNIKETAKKTESRSIPPKCSPDLIYNRSISRKLSELQKDINTLNTNIMLLKKELEALIEENKNLRGKLTEHSKEIKKIKENLKETK
jgi:chromosome segregation ATPase